MSGGGRGVGGGGGKEGVVDLSVENKSSGSSGSSYSGSERGSSDEISLRGTSGGGGPTRGGGQSGAAGEEQGREVESGKNALDSQQLKFYGRRNRAKQVDSNGKGGENRSDGVGVVRFLSVDLTEQLEAGIGQSSEFSVYTRYGSSGSLSPIRLQGPVRSRDDSMGHETVPGFCVKEEEGAGSFEQGKMGQGADEAEIVKVEAQIVEKVVSPQVEERDERRKNGVVGSDLISEALRGKDDFPSQLSTGSDGADDGRTPSNVTVILNDVDAVLRSPVDELVDRTNTAGGTSGSVIVDDAVLEEGQDVSVAEAHEYEPAEAVVQGSHEGQVRRSTTSVVKIKGSSSNGDKERHRKKGASRSLSRVRRIRVHLGLEHADDQEVRDSHDQESSALRNMPLQWRLDRERQHHEESVLAKAEEVYSKQEILDSTKKIPVKWKEPTRPKTHWDFVLEEMVWLSKDFEKERKWKLSQAKKVAIRVSRSKLDVEAKGLRRQKEEEQRTRRVASNVAKDVKKFWTKVEKLVMYKHQLELEERRKKALDKHLDFLLGQTERYSTMLAENLGDNLVSPTPKSLSLVPFDGTGLKEIVSIEQEVPITLRKNVDGRVYPTLSEVQITTSGADSSIPGKLRDYDEVRGLREGLPVVVLKELDAITKEVDVDMGDEDFNFDNELYEEDDETTMAADEALITEDERRNELSTLQRESELPLEELLKLYQRDGDRADDDSEDSVDDKSDVNTDEDGERPKSWKMEVVLAGERGSTQDDFASTRSGLLSSSWAKVEVAVENGIGSGISKQPGVLKTEVSSHHHGPCDPGHTSLVDVQPVSELDAAADVLGKWHLQRPGQKTFVPALSSLKGGSVDVSLQPSDDIIDDGEYIPATLADGNEEDDEATMEEEERLASVEANDPGAEMDLLQRESEMSLEEILAQYKSMASANDSHESFEDEEGLMEDRQDRTSEAGTSSSSVEIDEDSDVDVDVAKERMGEPSTSGREQWSIVSSGYGRKLKTPLNRNFHLLSNGTLSRGEGQMFSKWNNKQVASNLIVENGVMEHKSETQGAQRASFFLESSEDTDAETIAALARVSDAAKRRGERALERSRREGENLSTVTVPVDVDSPSRRSLAVGVEEKVGAAAIGETYDGKHSNLGGENVSLPSPQLDVVNGTRVLSKEAATVAEPSATKDVGNLDLNQLETGDGKTNEDKLADAAAEAQAAQPTGYTFSTTKVRTKLPFLLKHSLREYQHIGLDWLVTMYEKRLNGILADEMGLGKTIMTISLLAHLACDRGIWGPHLIVVPTSVMLNWETEFMKWCPAFKILTYFGSAKERKSKRQGWSKPNSFHVCITTYRLVIQDAKAFRRKKWKYLILDEAHLIKNWKSQRWQTLLNFNSKRRILLTGTPLQNDLMELWSLMHFLMPHVFQSHQEFRDWFSNPITGMVEGQEQINKEVVDRLHNVLRPFLLRRLKQDVEKQLPGKFEHVIRCRLSKRQRNLYEDFMANSDTQATLSSGNFLALINVLMQLRKVCNHPDLFEGRPIMSSFDMSGLSLHISSLICSTLQLGPFAAVNLAEFNLLFTHLEFEMTSWEGNEVADMCTPPALIEELSSTGEDTWDTQRGKNYGSAHRKGLIEEVQAVLKERRAKEKKDKIRTLGWLNLLRCRRRPIYGADLRKFVLVEDPTRDVHKIASNTSRFLEFSSVIADMVKLPLTRLEMVMGLVESFVFAIPAARAPSPLAWCSHPAYLNALDPKSPGKEVYDSVSTCFAPLRPVFVRRQLFFPDRRLLQFDCGKLQELAVLLQRLKSEGHRALIFTQMTKMLDVLEGFISLYGYTYMRLDGSTKPEQRQILMQRFNTNPKIFLFILSTRSGGVGINLVGADTVIFYDSDWNPAMDQQAQDRCHRIGQTREVHIYRLVSESTIEENILKKANQKRVLDDLVIQSGSYNTEFFKKLDPMELFSGLQGVKTVARSKGPGILPIEGAEQAPELSSAEVEAALKYAEDEADYMAMKRVEQEEAAENQEFTEDTFVGNIDDEEYDEAEEGRALALKNQTEVAGAVKDNAEESNKVTIVEEVSHIDSTLIPGDAEEEMDMLADVKQMAAAAAAAGRGSMSFEDQLHPVERYAMRFLELWDPRVDRASEAAQVLFEEKEWELDQLEKLKEEQEAEIDEDNEPLLYESWDNAFANEAYRQQVEVLAQQQESQRQLEWESMEEEMRDADRALAEASLSMEGAEHDRIRSKSLKNLKKAKFKSLRRGSLGSDEQILDHRDGIYRDSQFDMSPGPSRSPSQRKRKGHRLLEEEMLIEDYAKRMKKDPLKFRSLADKGMFSRNSSEYDLSSDDDSWPDAPDSEAGDIRSPNSLSAKRNAAGKITIMAWPLKMGPLITLGKERKKDASRIQECVTIADPWTSAEDAILCAVVHEYGGNWQLASDALSGMPDGSIYRGRHRHPSHCVDRLRQLLAQYASATNGDSSNERNSANSGINSHLKVTEEHTKRLLDVVLQLSDNEPLLQRHFGAVLTAVRNKVARKKAGLDNPGVLARNSGHPIHGGGFVSLLKTVDPHLPTYTSSLEKKAGSPKSCSDLALLVSSALGESELEEESHLRIVKDSIGTQLGKEQDTNNDAGEEDSSFQVTEFLELDAALPSSDDSESLLKYTPAVVSIEELFGLEPPPRPGPGSALRTSAEDLAEKRFRAATNTGWGAGVYEWASAAVSGLGSVGGLKGKAKKRPRPPDSSKPPKPKQPRMPKVTKKLSTEANASATARPPSKKKKNAQPAVSLSPAGGTSNPGSEELPQGAVVVNDVVHTGAAGAKSPQRATDELVPRQAWKEIAGVPEITVAADGAGERESASGNSLSELNGVGDINSDDQVSHQRGGKVRAHLSPPMRMVKLGT